MHRSTSSTRHITGLLAATAALALVALTACDRVDDAGAAATTPAGTSSAAPLEEDAQGLEGKRGDRPTPTHAPSPAATPTPSPTASPEPAAPAEQAGWWTPSGTPTWQYQLSGTPDVNISADILVSDLVETTAAQVAAVHARGAKAVCYVSAGSWEDWRADAGDFPAAVLGADLDGWPGERWLDVRATDTLLPLLERRVQACADKGFDAVEFDNVDGYANKTGFPLTAADQLAYNRSLADLAHAHGLAAALKNDIDQIADLEPAFDLAINESCLEWNECRAYRPFVAAGKPVLHVEYTQDMSFCTNSQVAGLSSIAKRENLDAWRATC